MSKGASDYAVMGRIERRVRAALKKHPGEAVVDIHNRVAATITEPEGHALARMRLRDMVLSIAPESARRCGKGCAS